MGGGHLPVHVELRAAPDDPLGQLVAATAAQHHAGAVEADPVEEAAHPRVLAHQRLVVGGEGLGAAHRALDTDLGRKEKAWVTITTIGVERLLL
jgi:hypothetical protein